MQNSPLILTKARKIMRALAMVGATIVLTACTMSDDKVFTLYRNSVTTGGDAMHIHVATFDSSDGESFNRGNCEQAQILFQNQQNQQSVKTKFWCEKGRYKIYKRLFGKSRQT